MFVTPSIPYNGCMGRIQPRDEAFIMTRVAMVESGCWEWLRQVCPRTGYGRTSRPNDRTPVGAHVLSYEIFKGPIEFGYVIDHTCSNRKCCNPHHLDAVTSQENNRRTSERGRHRNTQKDQCPRCNGPFDVVSTPSRPKPFRRCNQCHRAMKRNYARAQRAARRE